MTFETYWVLHMVGATLAAVLGWLVWKYILR